MVCLLVCNFFKNMGTMLKEMSVLDLSEPFFLEKTDKGNDFVLQHQLEVW